jgi:uncharacterized heparinase superfamily protein
VSALGRALLYARTVRHLRWEQWVYRPVRRLQQRLPLRLAPEARPHTGARLDALAAAVDAWGADDAGERIRRVDAVLRGEFRFLNHTESLPRIDWQHRYVSHLWSYNLHYFDYALDLARAYRATGDARYRDRFAELADGWIAANPAGRGDGGEPYAVSLRVVNWLYALMLLGAVLDTRLIERVEASVALQLEYLSRRLELHLLANHLQKNLKALVVGGLYFRGRSAERWLARGSRLLWRELFEQVLPDGVQYERSPMYHAIALADFLEVLDLLRVAGEPMLPEAAERVARMVDAFGVLSRPDGALHLFADAAHGIAPSRDWLDGLARRVVGRGVPRAEGALALPHAGYHGFADDAAGERLLVSCGGPGPSYQPGHAHCDLLSFELDIAGRPLVVDAGVSGYDGDPYREYVRSTRAHNTVVIDGREQSEVWGTFRMARRARVRSAEWRTDGEKFVFSGTYSPYHDPRAVHERTLERAPGHLVVRDRVYGAAGAPLRSFLHLHPAWDVALVDGRLVARAGDAQVVLEPFGVDRVRIVRGERDPVQGWHCPEFGRALPAAAIEMEIDHNDGREFGCHIHTSRIVS